jgi:polysaccharide export outer membrane protein
MESVSTSLTRRPAALLRGWLLVVVASVFTVACASTPVGQFEWAEEYIARTPSATDASYQIGVGDLLAVQVFDNDKMSTRGRVRGDGKLAVPLINDVIVAGKAPTHVASDIEKMLKDGNLVLNPHVNVDVEDVLPVRITVLGAVARAGNYSVERGSGVAEALAGAGGLTDFAHKDRIFVIRKVPTPVRIRFTFSSLTDIGRAGAFRLAQGDIVVVD